MRLEELEHDYDSMRRRMRKWAFALFFSFSFLIQHFVTFPKLIREIPLF